MTVPSTARRAGPLLGNGVTTSFPFSFRIFQASDIRVVKTLAGVDTNLVLNTDYTVAVNVDQPNNPGGSIIPTVVAATGVSFVVIGNAPYEQSTDLPDGGAFRAEQVEDGFDKLAIQIQQMNEKVGRSLAYTAATGEGFGTLPDVATRAGKFLVFDALGVAGVASGTGADGALRTDLAANNGVLLANGAVKYVAAITSASASGLTNGLLIVAAGRATAGDGGGGVFRYDSASVATSDGGVIFTPSAGSGRFFRDGYTVLGYNGPVSARWYGATGDDLTDNATALTAWLAYCQASSSAPYLPTGVYRTSGAHALSVTGRAISPYGDGPSMSILKATANQDVLTVTGASECAVRGIGFDKVTRNQLGKGLVIKNTAYAVIDHVTTYGFQYGFYTEDALTTLFIKPLARFCEIGCFLSFTTLSRPNAITILNPSFSLNTRFGLRASEPASLLVMGGSIEGNGWDFASFHGGIYVSNAGTEGAVGITIDSVHMEQNHGEADIYMDSALNASTVYNINNCAIFPIDNTHITTNRIFVNNAVAQTLNLKGNNFKHYGSYTPNAGRKNVAALSTTLLTINTGGDSVQFFSATETPDLSTWGPNVVREAMLRARATITNAGAAAISGSPYNVASVVRNSAGNVTVTFSKAMASTDYQVVATMTAAAKVYEIVSKAAGSFVIQTRDLAGVAADSGFDFMVA